jgi:hypothetical protein
VTLLAVRVALDPTPAQERALRSHAGAARVAFNWGLARVKANLSQREAEASYGLAGDDLTPYVDWSFYGLRKGVERRQGHGRAVVAGELERGLRDRPGTPRPSAQELVGIAAR